MACGLSHPSDEKDHICKEIGAFRVWEKSKSEDEVFKIYLREYKKRFSWIRAGRITKDEFYAWSIFYSTSLVSSA